MTKAAGLNHSKTAELYVEVSGAGDLGQAFEVRAYFLLRLLTCLSGVSSGLRFSTGAGSMVVASA